MTSLRYKKNAVWFYFQVWDILLQLYYYDFFFSLQTWLHHQWMTLECEWFSALKALDVILPSVETMGLFTCHISTQLHLPYARLIPFQLQRRSGTCQCNLRQFRFNCFLFISSVSLLRKLIAAAAACLSLLAKACILVCYLAVCVAVMSLLAPAFFLAEKRTTWK